ncbi:MAG: hypothetical protein ACLQVL_01915 [Terriglobia bacterium]
MLRPVPRSAPVSVLLVALSVFLSFDFDLPLACQAGNATDEETPLSLHITVLQGEDGVNILKTKMAVQPVIEVRDKNNLPVSGVAVIFAAPTSGPRVTFAHGGDTFITTTNASGRAVAPRSKPVGRGSFKIRVQADLHGQVVTTSIAQTNYVTAAAAGATGAGVGAGVGAGAAGAGISTTMMVIIGVGVAAAVGVAVGVAKSRGGAPTTAGTIGGAGSPTITAPH